MPQVLWSQDIFSKGELSPLMYSRVTVTAYYNGLKVAQNCITYPQGGIGKRFGTIYNANVPYLTDYREAYFQSFQYLNECVYIIIFVPDKILIYLEGNLIFTVTGTGLDSSEVRLIDSTVLDSSFVVTTGLEAPKFLNRSALSPNVVTGITATPISTLTLTTAVPVGIVLPIEFTVAGGTFPLTSPPIRVSNTYFAYTVDANTIEIYANAPDAKARINKISIISAGTGTTSVLVLNSWAYTTIPIINFPVFDFGQKNYSAITFTPAFVSGFNINLTASAPVFNSSYVGGAVFGNGGIARIVSITSSTVAVINIQTPFASTAAIPGTQFKLMQPAWGDDSNFVVGWPSKCSSFQNRAIYANSSLLPNGLWLSAINAYNDFDGLEGDDDQAISWYPSSGNVNYIRFIVPYRSLTVHTNTGIYSTPLAFEQAITPDNFSMTLQDSTPATAIQPRGIDNQIIILSGNDVHSMLWDGFNNSYTSNIASIANEHLIRSPHDEASYVDLNKAGSRYMFIINDDGTMIIFQTLISEDVNGFTPARLKQSFGNAYFRWATSSSDGRAWFLTERQIASEGSPSPITGFTEFQLYSGENFELLSTEPMLLLDGTDFLLLSNILVFFPGEVTPFKFTTTGSLPISFPQVQLDTFYWAVADDQFFFKVYLTANDAEQDINPIQFFSAGVDSFVTPWELATQFMLEELSFDVKTDCSNVYSGIPTSEFTGLPRFDAQEVKINGDGFGFDFIGDNDTVKTIAHGEEVEVSKAFMGFPIETIITPLQVSPLGGGGAKSSSIAYPQHIRVASFFFVDTIGGDINGTPINLKSLEETDPGIPPEPQTGFFQMSFMLGWNQDSDDEIIITHDDPFDIKLTGIFYRIEQS